MTQEQINEIVEEYRRCKYAFTRVLTAEQKRYYQGRMEGIKITLEVAGVYVKEVAMLL